LEQYSSQQMAHGGLKRINSNPPRVSVVVSCSSGVVTENSNLVHLANYSFTFTNNAEQSLAISPVKCQLSAMSVTFTTPPPLEEIRAVVRSVCADMGVARVDLFGSLARGSGSDGSDVDLLVEFLPGSDIGLFEMGALKEDLEERLGCRVDLVSRRAVERSRNPIRRNAILSDLVPLYAR